MCTRITKGDIYAFGFYFYGVKMGEIYLLEFDYQLSLNLL